MAKEPLDIPLNKEAVIHIAASTSWRFNVTEHGNVIGTCDDLKMVFQAESLPELIECIEGGLEALVEDLADTGDLTQFLNDHGWTMQRISTGEAEEGRFNLPLSLAWGGKHDFAQPIHR